MIFSIQRYLEDSFDRRDLRDADQYAVKLANLYARKRHLESDPVFLKSVRRVQTAFYRNNTKLVRREFEEDLLRRLDQKFQKKNLNAGDLAFAGGLWREREKFRKLRRRSIGALLTSFQRTTEARAVDTLWQSRKSGKLRRRPEKVAQGMLSSFVGGVLTNGPGHNLRELVSGIGFVDVAVILASVKHLVEMKILTGKFTGVAQLDAYMATEARREGWLVVFDARPPGKQVPLPDSVQTAAGVVRLVRININPVPPSRR